MQNSNYNLQGGLVKKTEGRSPPFDGEFIEYKWLRRKGIIGDLVIGSSGDWGTVK
jgi:hypothetical protein